MVILHGEVEAILTGRRDELVPPQPFRNLVAQARLGLGVEEHERYFRARLGDIDEPTTPFGGQPSEQPPDDEILQVREDDEPAAAIEVPRLESPAKGRRLVKKDAATAPPFVQRTGSGSFCSSTVQVGTSRLPV